MACDFRSNQQSRHLTGRNRLSMQNPVCPSGRVQITGTVISVQERKDSFGTKLQITVKDDEGFVVKGWLPRGTLPDTNIRVAFVARIIPSEMFPGEGYFKNPRNGKFLGRVPDAPQEEPKTSWSIEGIQPYREEDDPFLS